MFDEQFTIGSETHRLFLALPILPELPILRKDLVKKLGMSPSKISRTITSLPSNVPVYEDGLYIGRIK